MSEFKNIKQVYSHLEKHAFEYKFEHQIGDLFKALRDSLLEAGKKKESSKAQWEIDFFNFRIVDGECKPTWSGVQKDGKEYEYPSFLNFTEETLEYLVNRLSSSKHKLLTSRYSHILWCSKRRHYRYAKIAFDSYLDVIEEFEKKDLEQPEEFFGNDIIQSVRNAYYLSTRIKYKFDIIKNKIISLIKIFNEESSYCFALKYDLIKLMLKHNKKFLTSDFVGIPDVCWNLSNKLLKESRFQNSIDILQLGKKIEQKMSTSNYDWDLGIAEGYEYQTKNATSSMVAISFCKSAIQYFKKKKMNEKVAELEGLFKKFREEIEMGEYHTDIDLSEHRKACRKIASNISKLEPLAILNTLMADKNLLPRRADLEMTVKKNSKDFPLQHLFPITVHDSNGNPVQHFSKDDEQLYYHILHQFGLELQLEKSYLIHEIIYKSIKAKKITSNLLFEFFQKYSWFGQNLEKVVFNKKVTYNWLSLIMPSIHEYIFQLNNLLYVKGYYPNLVLAIDSLTLKLEGLFRDFCTFAGITTFYFKQDNQNRDLAREKDINMLMREKPVQDLFDEDDLLFFNYLLVEKAGINLRHKVAHSLMLFDEYNIHYFHLLLICLLKLGKYNFAK